MKRTLLIFLCLIICLPLFMACGGDENSGTGSGSAKTSSGETDGAFVPHDEKFEGSVLRIFGRKSKSHTYAQQQWVYDEEKEGDPINMVVQDREFFLEEQYGITIRYIPTSEDEYSVESELRSAISANLDMYDVVVDSLNILSRIAIENYLQDMGSLEYIDLSKPWWDATAIRESSVNEKTFFACGDILITDDEYTYCIIYNRQMYKEFGLEKHLPDGKDIYQTVKDGEWTYDILDAMAKDVYQDLNNDSRMVVDDDRFGLLIDAGCLAVLMSGSGWRMANFNADGIPYLDVISGNAVEVEDKAFEICTAPYTVNSDMVGGDNNYGRVEKCFGDNRGLFNMTKLCAMTSLKNGEYEVEYGVLPIPKFSASQDSYHNSVAHLHFSMVAIPITNVDNLKMTCYALDALGYYGQKELTNAYVQTTLKYRRLIVDEDAEMVDVILQNRTFDLARTFNWGTLDTAFLNTLLYRNTNNFISTWESLKDGAEIDLAKTLEKLAENG